MGELQKHEPLTKEQMALIKATVAKNASDEELRLFLYRCKMMDLDPLKPGQIHFIKYGSNPGTMVVGIDGFRSKAMKTGKHVGTKRGVVRNDHGDCVGAWAEVYRSDWQHPAREEVALSEYNTGKGNWAKMPETMIKKVAEVAALRMAFPDDLGGLYSDEEMDQAKDVTPSQPVNFAPQATKPLEQMTTEELGEMFCPLKKFKNKKISEIEPDALANYIQWLEDQAQLQGKTPTGAIAEFIEASARYLTAAAKND